MKIHKGLSHPTSEKRNRNLAQTRSGPSRKEFSSVLRLGSLVSVHAITDVSPSQKEINFHDVPMNIDYSKE